MDPYDSIRYNPRARNNADQSSNQPSNQSSNPLNKQTLNPINVVALDTWGGSWNPGSFYLFKRPSHIFHMSTSTKSCKTPEECKKIMTIMDYKKTKLQSKKDLRYNFVVGGDLNIYEVRGMGVEPLLPVQYHKQYGRGALLFGYIGNFTDDAPTDMMNVVYRFTKILIRNGAVDFSLYHHKIFDKDGLEPLSNKPIQEQAHPQAFEKPIRNNMRIGNSWIGMG